MLLGRTAPPTFNLEAAAAARAKNAEPDPDPRVWMGKEFTKTLPLRCPWCRNVFYAWQAVGQETAPFEDPTPFQAPGKGQRWTCGHPVCWDKEQDYQIKQTDDYQRTRDNFFSSKEPSTKTFKPQKLTPLAGIR